MSGRPRSLLAWLLLAQAAVLIVLAGVAVVVAGVAGPPLFHEHVEQAGAQSGAQASGERGSGEHGPEEQAADLLDHVEQAFVQTGLLTLGLALGVALAVAAVVTVVLARRVVRPLGRLRHAADAVAAGRFDDAVSIAGAGTAGSARGAFAVAEVVAVAEATGDMAARVAATEQVRRRMLSDLGHELRTPIATLRVYVDALEDGVGSPDEALGVLRDQVDRLDRLAGDLYAVSRAEEAAVASLRRRRVDLADLVRSAAAAHPGAPAVDVRGPVTVSADPDRLGQVLTNLLDNAVRHAGPGGRVVVRVRRVGARAVLVVSDDGDGIAAEHLPHVFERFYRADAGRSRAAGRWPTPAGTGIGLAICADLVRAHGGEIVAASDGPGRGASFTVTLPIIGAPAA